MAVALGTNLRNLADFKHNLVVEGPDFNRREEVKTNGDDIFIGCIVTKEDQTRPYVLAAAEDNTIAGIIEGYTNRDEPDRTYGYWYWDEDVPFADGKWVIMGQLVPGQILWVVSETNTTIWRGDPLIVVTNGVLTPGSTGDDIIFVAEEDIVAAANVRYYFRAKVVSG